METRSGGFGGEGFLEEEVRNFDFDEHETSWLNQDPLQKTGEEDIARNVSKDAFTDSYIALVFDDKSRQEKITNANNSSVSLIDLEEIGINDDSFLCSDKLQKAAPQNDLGASPIPFATGMDECVTKTPTTASQKFQVSSPFQASGPEGRKRPFSISSTSASPIAAGNVIASTPFHGRVLSSLSEIYENPVNVTYHLEENAFDSGAQAASSDPSAEKQNSTFSKKANRTETNKQPNIATGKSLNSTYTAPSDQKPATDSHNSTYNASKTSNNAKGDSHNSTYNASGPQKSAVLQPKSAHNSTYTAPASEKRSQNVKNRAHNSTYNADACQTQTDCHNSTYNAPNPSGVNPKDHNSTYSAPNSTNNAQNTPKYCNTTYNAHNLPGATSKDHNSTYNAPNLSSKDHNSTYNSDHYQNPTPSSKNTQCNETFNTESCPKTSQHNAHNATFDKAESKAGNSTFCKDVVASLSKSADCVEEIHSQLTDTGVMMPEETPPHEDHKRHNASYTSQKTCGQLAMDDSGPKSNLSARNQRQSSATGLRKPLSLVNNPGNVRPKSTSSLNSSPPNSNHQSKKSSRLAAPRMNTAAISRIQARSPQKTSDPHHRSQDENQVSSTTSNTSMKPPKSTSLLRKPQARKGTTVASRKSLLPPSGIKQRTSSASSVSTARKSLAPTSNGKPPSEPPLTPSKRKAESPKNSAGRTAKFDPNKHAPPSTTTTTSGGPRHSTSSSLRSGGAVTSRIASSSSRSGSKLQRPHVTSSNASIPEVTSSSVVGSQLRSRTGSAKLPKIATKRGHRSPDSIRLSPPVNQSAQCAVAMATLLDYVVNKLDGLSAPKLAASKQCLERLVDQQTHNNDDLTSKVDQLTESLRQSRDAHQRDVTQARERYDSDITELKRVHGAELRQLNETLQELSGRLTKLQEEHDETTARLKDDFAKQVSDLGTRHEEEVTRLQMEWSDERHRMEMDSADLRENFKQRVDQKVEELVQPYKTAHEENESLRAVLEMKNADHHRLEREISQHGDQQFEVRTLRDQLIGLQQKNEDLVTQLADKSNEQRSMKQQIDQLRSQRDEQQHKSNTLQQRYEEAVYRLNSNSPTPSSPFNPIFTPSPTSAGPNGNHLFGGTPQRHLGVSQGENPPQSSPMQGASPPRVNGAH